MKNIILVEPQHLVRAGIVQLLNNSKAFTRVIGFDNGKALLENIPKLSADLVIISTNVQDISILALLKRYKRDYPAIKLLILANDINPIIAKNYLHAGADGYIAKTSSEQQFIDAIKKLAQNKLVVPEALMQDMTSKDQKEETSPFDLLSDREMDILLLMLKGKSVKAISDILHLSPKTISTYKGRIFDKLKVNSLMEIFMLATELGLLTSNQYV